MSNYKNLDERVKLAANIFHHSEHYLDEARAFLAHPFQIDEFYSSTNGHTLFVCKRVITSEEPTKTYRNSIREYIDSKSHAVHIGYIATDEVYMLITIKTGEFDYITNNYPEEIYVKIHNDLFSSDRLLEIIDAAKTLGAAMMEISYNTEFDSYYFAFSDDIFILSMPLNNDEGKLKSDMALPLFDLPKIKEPLPPLDDKSGNKWIKWKKEEEVRQKKEYEEGNKFFNVRIVKYAWVQVYAHNESEAEKFAEQYGDDAADFDDSEIEINSKPEEFFFYDLNTYRGSKVIDSDGSHHALEWSLKYSAKKK